MIKLIYDKGNCVGCPPEMGCMGKDCPQCWETHLFCDICKEEVDALFRGKATGIDACEDCRDAAYTYITIDNAGDFIDESDYS